MPATMQSPHAILEDARARRAERLAERAQIEEKLTDGPRTLAEGRGTPGETARLKAELSDLNDAIGYLDGHIAGAEAEIAAENARKERQGTVARMAGLADRATRLHTELEEARRVTARAIEQGVRTMQTALQGLVAAQRDFDTLGETLVPGFSKPYQLPWEGREQIKATVREIGQEADSMRALLTEWRSVGGEYTAPSNQRDYRHAPNTPVLIDLGDTGRLLDTAAGFRQGGYNYTPKG